ncbi:MAG: DUF4011 domain-containing protein [Gammaproteobacteria bacterium]|nr:DUF4011 domain-containing protein [Gammaproteobacteria bacterium]
MDNDQLTRESHQVSHPTNTEFSFESMEAVRKKLLDLTSRNTLLNYKHPKASCVRIIDNSLDHIMKIFQAGDSFTCIPVPEPTERELIEAGYIKIDERTREKKTLVSPKAAEWVEHLGLSSTYDLTTKLASKDSKNKYQEVNLQTLYYPAKLESRLRNIRHKAETAIAESGTNILYLALGFLEWYESRDSEMPRLAPLFTLPICLQPGKLDRNNGVYRYTISPKDDGLLTNITLQMKLANDFDLALPSIGEDTFVTAYLKEIQSTILRHKPRWKILQQASVVLLNFSKQAMYQDLDPANWPANARIENHPLIQQFFRSDGQELDSSILNYAPEHSIDHIEKIHDQFPLIFEADSSQHSALIDAAKGENLVIEGPPGSGKSQTIANLIAACIANGKKILFVAEKMAALNVVKRRLDFAGLGDFCLELHSHKTSKQQIVQNLSQRLHKEWPSPSSIQTDIAHFEFLKGKLHDYVKLINSEWRQTGLTIHNILNTATRYREQLNLNPDHLSIADISGHNLTQEKNSILLENVKLLRDVYNVVSKQATDGKIVNHHWYGVNNTEMKGYQAESLKQYLKEWTKHLNELRLFWQKQIKLLALDIDDDTPMPTIYKVSDALLKLPEQKGGELLQQLPKIIQHTEDFAVLLAEYEDIHQQLSSLENIFKPSALNNSAAPLTIKAALNSINELGAEDSCSLELLVFDCEVLKRTEISAQAIHTQFQQIIPRLPPSLHPIFTVSERGLKEFVTLINLIKQLPVDLWNSRDSIFDNYALDDLLEQLTEELRILTPLHKELSGKFALQRLPSAAELKQHQDAINNSGFCRYFSSSWRKSRKAVLALSAVSKPNKKSLISLLPRLIEYVDGVSKIDKINQENQVLGDRYRGAETPMERINILRHWYKAVRQEYGIGFGDRVFIGNALLMTDWNLAILIGGNEKQSLIHQVESLMQIVIGYQKRFKGFKPLTNIQIDMAGTQSPLAQLRNILEKSLSTLEGCALNADNNVDQLTTAVIKLEETHKKIECWQQATLTQWLVPQHLTLSVIAGEFSPQILAACKRTQKIAEIVAPIPALVNSIADESNDLRYQALRSCARQLEPLIETVRSAESRFIEQGNVSICAWTATSKNAIHSLISRNQRALDNPRWLNNWLDYIRIKNKRADEGLANIINSLEANNINAKDLTKVVQLAIHHQLAIEVLAEHEVLSQFNGLEHTAICQQFKEYDKKILELQRQNIAFKASQTLPPRWHCNRQSITLH